VRFEGDVEHERRRDGERANDQGKATNREVGCARWRTSGRRLELADMDRLRNRSAR